MDFLLGLAGLYLLYFVAVRSLPYVITGIGWALSHAAHGVYLLLRSLFIALGMAGRGIGGGLKKPWHAFHRLRLGKDEFFARGMAGSWVAEYAQAQKERGQREAREKYKGLRRVWHSLKWELWAIRMRIYGLCFHIKAKEFVAGVHEQQKREAQRRRAEEAARATAQRRREEEEQNKRRAQERAQQRRQEREKHRAQSGQAARSPYGEALFLLGLQEHFTRRSFQKAYRKAMTAAHPDAGGTTEEAQAINAARDLIRKRNGW